MEQKKIGFFKRLKIAITNFDEYQIFVEEKISVAIRYILKFTLIFSIILSVALTIKVSQEANRAIQSFREECPEFKFENNSLIVETENRQFINGDEAKFFGIIIDGQNEDLNNIEQEKEYQRVIAFLKDKVIIKDAQGVQMSVTYEQLSDNYDLNYLNKQNILNTLTDTNMAKVYVIFMIIFIVYLFILYSLRLLLDILLLSIIGVILSKIIRINLKFKSVFNISAYAISLSVVLCLIYLIANLFTGFEIRYFDIAYNAISYIYITTAMLMMKSDLTKTQIQVAKIVQEQKKVKEEIEEKNKEEEKKQEKPKEKQNEKKKEDKKEKQDNKEVPEGGLLNER